MTGRYKRLRDKMREQGVTQAYMQLKLTPEAVDVYSQTASQFVDVVGEAVPGAAANFLLTGNPLAGGVGAGAGGLQAVATELWEGSGDPNKALVKGRIAVGAELLGNVGGGIIGGYVGNGAAGKAADIALEGIEENIEGAANALSFGEDYTLKDAIKDNIMGMAAGGAILGTIGNASTDGAQAGAGQPTAGKPETDRPTAVKGDDVSGRVLNMPDTSALPDNITPMRPETQDNMVFTDNVNPTPIEGMMNAIDALAAKKDFTTENEFSSERTPTGELRGFTQRQVEPQPPALRLVRPNETAESQNEATDQPASNIVPMPGKTNNTDGKTGNAFETQGDLALQPEQSKQPNGGAGRKWAFDPNVLPDASSPLPDIDLTQDTIPDISQDTDAGDVAESQDTAATEQTQSEASPTDTGAATDSQATSIVQPGASPAAESEAAPDSVPRGAPIEQPEGMPAPAQEPQPQLQPALQPQAARATPQTQPTPQTAPQPQPTPDAWPTYDQDIVPFALPSIATETEAEIAANPAIAAALALGPLREPAAEVAVEPSTEPALQTNLALQISDQDRDEKRPEYNSNMQRGQGATGEVHETDTYNMAFGILSSG